MSCIEEQMVMFLVGGAVFTLLAVMLMQPKHGFEPPTLLEVLDMIHDRHVDKWMDTVVPLKKKVISALAVEELFKEPAWRCNTKGEIARVEIYARLHGMHEVIAAWWARVVVWWTIEHGSAKARNALVVKRIREEAGIE